MRIVDVADDNIKACCQFEFRGWTVSVSTIFKKSTVRAWKWNAMHQMIECNTVEQVLEEIIKIS